MIGKLREPVNGLTHFFTAIAAAFGLALLLFLGRHNGPKEIALLVYGISLVALFSASAIYHLVDAAPEVMLRLRKMDHSAIYLLIAGTYTPICLHFFTGFFQWGLPLIVWIMALTGVTVKIFVLKAPRWINTAIYLAMGWLCLLDIPEVLNNMPAGALAGLVIGGLFYTLGAVVYITKKPDFFPNVFGFHEIWHIFVILGALSHFVLIATFVAPV